MEIFVARQPVFDSNLSTVAYSLYYRDSITNASGSSSDEATASVIINGSLMVGLDILTDHTKAIIKFTNGLLLNDTASLLVPDKTIIDILEPVAHEALLDAIYALKSDGFTISIDGAHNFQSLPELIEYVDIIRVDFSTNGVSGIQKILLPYAAEDVQLMAVKVETREQYEFAKSVGFKLFQGNFFKKPTVIASKDIKGFKNSHLLLMKELYSPAPDFEKISSAVIKDLGLTYRLLKVVNSVAYRGANNITDIRQALVRLGMRELYKWFGLIVLSDFCNDRPQIYARNSAIRAKALENLATALGTGDSREELFLVGMFSMIDIILERPMEEILEDLPLSDSVKEALTDQNSHLRRWLDMIIAYEEGRWDTITEMEGISSPELSQSIFRAYFDAVDWSSTLMNEL